MLPVVTTKLDVDGLIFTFPPGWQASKYDEWQFYRQQFSRMRKHIKALDILAVAPDKTAWLIEVKDYRWHVRTKPSDLAAEVAQKAFDTLAALLPCKVHANDLSEKNLARAMLTAHRLRLILHLEQPAKRSRLFPQGISAANVQQKLRQLVKPIDAHPSVLNMHTPNIIWQISKK